MKIDPKATIVRSDDEQTSNPEPNKVVEMIDNLRNRMKAWEAQVDRGHDALYDVLADCLRLYEYLIKDDEHGEEARSMFDAMVADSAIRFKKSTHSTKKIANLVFADRKLANAHGLAMQIAVDNDITSDNFKTFVRGAGGLEALRMSNRRSNSKMATPEQVIKHILERLQQFSLAEVKSENLKKECDLTRIGKPAVFIATQKANATFTIHSVIVTQSVVEHVVKSLRKSNAAEIGRAAVIASIKTVVDSRASALTDAINEIRDGEKAAMASESLHAVNAVEA